MTLTIGIVLASLVLVSLALRDDLEQTPDRPQPIVRAELSGRGVELREAASTGLRSAHGEPEVAAEASEEADADTASLPLPDPPPHTVPPAASPAATETAAEAPAAPLGGRDFDQSEATVRRLLALYAQLEERS